MAKDIQDLQSTRTRALSNKRQQQRSDERQVRSQKQRKQQRQHEQHRRQRRQQQVQQVQQVQQMEAIKNEKAIANVNRKIGYTVEDNKQYKRPQSIWEKIAEERMYPQLREMGDSYEAIDRFQRKRVITALLFGMLVLLLGYLTVDWFYFASPIVTIVSYKMQIRKIDDYYRAWKFERQLNFSKFTRLVIPYLKASDGNMALYTIFNRILQRLDNEADKINLYRLMGEMSDNPSDIQPFLDYAERSSGTDMSHLFMSTIFDFQQTTFNTAVIDELGKIASEDMMNSIDEIIEMKLRRFDLFPTKTVMASFILVVGLGAGLLFHNLKDINFSGDDITLITEASSDNSVTDELRGEVESLIDTDVNESTDDVDIGIE